MYSYPSVASQNPRQKVAYGERIMKQLAERMMIKGERNLDLLLGVLAYTGW